MTEEQAPKRLYRAHKNHIIGGVCAGFADYLNIDVTLIRILWLVAAFLNGIGIIAYLICLIVLPVNPEHQKLPEQEKKKSKNAGLFIGIFLVLLGFFFLAEEWWFFPFFFPPDWFWFWRFHWDIVWPILLILIGLGYIFYVTRKGKETAEKKKTTTIFRKKREKQIGGVCAGLADYWNVDMSLVRIGYVLFTVFTHLVVGIVLYVVLMIIMPEEPDTPQSG